MHNYDHQSIEKKWQEKWEEQNLYRVANDVPGKENFFTLVEYPYPSGNLHIGHWYAFAVPDIFARYKRMQGFNVLYPIGFDSFGLPAENAAIKYGKDPKAWTEGNIAHMTTQIKSMGNMFDWSRQVVASDPSYYQWTQWLFGKLFEAGLAYRSKELANWCPKDLTVLANEQVVDGKCERCGSEVEKREQASWFLRITDYADRLLEDLEDLNWPEEIKTSQRNWIGKSEGAIIPFTIPRQGKALTLEVFTTRPDTLFGATYMVLAPEHPLLPELKDSITNWTKVEKYQQEAKKKSDIERTAEGKEKTGVKLEGITAINPGNQEEIPVFIADYVLAHYGTGAIMAVPAHDERDYAFARKFDLPIRQVIAPVFMDAIRPHQEGVPVEERTTVCIVLLNNKDEILVLDWKGEEWGENKPRTLITGGRENDEDIISAAIRELNEETGFTEVKHLKTLHESHYHGYAAHKRINRIAHTTTLLFKLLGNDQEEISSEELSQHEFVFVSIEEAKQTLSHPVDLYRLDQALEDRIWTGAGELINSDSFTGTDSEQAKQKITEAVGGTMKSTYRMRDWSVSRQRYWGCPIPIVYDPEGKPHLVPEEHLPWTLPEDVDFRPTGEAPLARSEELKARTEKIFGRGWTPEVDTFDTFVDSSWYYLRYVDAGNPDQFATPEALKAWLPIKRYSGGAEHTTMHVLYSRFWHKALFDLGLTFEPEPYLERMNRGQILGPDGKKMSKSKGNVVDPDEHVARVGADTVKMYLAFMGPYNIPGQYPFDLGGIAGMRRFLERVVRLQENIRTSDILISDETTLLLNQTIKKVGEDIEDYKFNTAISQLMILVNHLEKVDLAAETYATLLQLLAPFAPHLIEELWEQLGKTSSIHLEDWPTFDPNKLEADTVTIAIQINGKVRDTLQVSRDSDPETTKSEALTRPAIEKWLAGQEPKKVIYVPNKIVNIVV